MKSTRRAYMGIFGFLLVTYKILTEVQTGVISHNRNAWMCCIHGSATGNDKPTVTHRRSTCNIHLNPQKEMIQ